LSEKCLKKLIGKTNIEDALKRLDKLTDEEAHVRWTVWLRSHRPWMHNGDTFN
jgi:hypothetical protein